MSGVAALVRLRTGSGVQLDWRISAGEDGWAESAPWGGERRGSQVENQEQIRSLERALLWGICLSGEVVRHKGEAELARSQNLGDLESMVGNLDGHRGGFAGYLEASEGLLC